MERERETKGFHMFSSYLMESDDVVSSIGTFLSQFYCFSLAGVSIKILSHYLFNFFLLPMRRVS